jgi:hypothetical protein
MTSELAGNLQFAVMPKMGTSLKDMEKEIRNCLEEFAAKGVSDEDIIRFRQKMEASMINELESVSGKASQLAEFFTFTGNADYTKENLRRYTSVTKEDVMRVFNQYVKGKPMLVLSVLTKGNEANIAGPVEHFDMYGEVRTIYSQTYWTRNAPIPLPEELVKRFANGGVMAITGYEIDQVTPTAKPGIDV